MSTEEHHSNRGTREGGYGAPDPEDEMPHEDVRPESGEESADEGTADDGEENQDGS